MTARIHSIVFITGASSGIGRSCAQKFAEAGARLILVARRKERLIKLAAKFKKQFNTESFVDVPGCTRLSCCNEVHTQTTH